METRNRIFWLNYAVLLNRCALICVDQFLTARDGKNIAIVIARMAILYMYLKGN